MGADSRVVADPFGELELTRARFADLTVVIIGGSSDIGKACAAVALREGGTVVLTGRSRGSLQSAAAELSPIGTVGMVELDVTDPSSVDAFPEVLGVDHSHIDVLVIASGQTRVEPRNGVTADHFDSVMAVNARGPYLVMNTVLHDESQTSTAPEQVSTPFWHRALRHPRRSADRAKGALPFSRSRVRTGISSRHGIRRPRTRDQRRASRTG